MKNQKPVENGLPTLKWFFLAVETYMNSKCVNSKNKVFSFEYEITETH